MTFGGQPLARIGAAVSTDVSAQYRSELWGLVGPAVGTAAVSVSFSGTDAIEAAVGGALSLYNVDQGTPWGTFADSGGTSGAPQVTIASRPTDLVFDVIATKGNNFNTVLPGSGQAEVWNRQTGNDEVSHVIGAASRSEGSTAVEVVWRMTSPEPWALAAVPIQPVIGFADLDLSVSADPRTVDQGDTVLCTVTLANQGPDPATNVVIADSLVAGLEYVSHTASQGTYSSATSYSPGTAAAEPCWMPYYPRRIARRASWSTTCRKPTSTRWYRRPARFRCSPLDA